MQHARLPVGGDRFESRDGKNYRNSFDHNWLDHDMVIDCFGANRKCANFPIEKVGWSKKILSSIFSNIVLKLANGCRN